MSNHNVTMIVRTSEEYCNPNCDFYTDTNFGGNCYLFKIGLKHTLSIDESGDYLPNRCTECLNQFKESHVKK